MRTERSHPGVGGLQPLTMIDFPGKIAAVVFFRGCNLRCTYCHNPTLLENEEVRGDVSWDEVYTFLQERRGFLEGVVFSGGEPTAQPELYHAVQEVRRLGYDVALHTNGSFPDLLARLLHEELVSFTAMDLKAPLGDYQRITGVAVDSRIEASARMIAASGVSHEFRTTVHPELLGGNDLLRIGSFLASIKAQHYVLQKFKSGETYTKLGPAGDHWLDSCTLSSLRRMLPSVQVRSDTPPASVPLTLAA